MLENIIELSRATGRLRELVGLLGRLWYKEPMAFEAFLVQSSDKWAKHPRIPCALRILTTKINDRMLRDILQRVCESSTIPFREKQFLYFVAALWGDEWAMQFHKAYLDREVDKAARSGSGLSSLLWALQCGARLQQYSGRSELERLQVRLSQEDEQKAEYFAMVEALLELERNGFDGLAKKLQFA